MADDVGERIVALLMLLDVAQGRLACLDKDRSIEAQVCKVKLHGAVDTVRRELARAQEKLDRAMG